MASAGLTSPSDRGRLVLGGAAFESMAIRRLLRGSGTRSDPLPTSVRRNRIAELTTQLRIWSKLGGRGISFDSSTGFRLPNGAVRSPDASWVDRIRLDSLSIEERKKFLPLCPDFVVELRSATDSLSMLQEKMQEYLENGVHLGWLIDAEQRRVYIYRPALEVEVLDNPASLNGDPVLTGFVLDLNEIW